MDEKKYKALIFSLVIGLWFLPMLSGLVPAIIPIQLKPLGGSFSNQTTLPTFTWREWLAGNFQEASGKYIEEHIGFRSTFIRVRNQVDFSFFKKSNAVTTIVGKDNYLFSDRYIYSALGNNFVGEEKIKMNVQKARLLQDELKKKNIDIVYVIAPGKGFYYPEYIPEEFKKNKADKTNYEYFVKFMKEQKINFVDFNQYFMDQKSKSAYCLYPKTGIHWSCYGGTLAGDSVVRYIEKLRNIDMPDIIFDSLEISSESRSTDNDILQSLNLFFDVPNPPLVYVNLKFENANEKQKPDVLTIGDSFYWNIFNQNIPHNLFKTSEFWYYSRQAFTVDCWNHVPVESFNFREKVLTRDVIVIIQSESNLDDFGFGFIDRAYNLFYADSDLEGYLKQVPDKATLELKDAVEKYMGEWLDKKSPNSTTYREGLNRLWLTDGTFLNDFNGRWKTGFEDYIKGGTLNSDYEMAKKEGFPERNFASYLVPHIIWWANK